MELLQKGASDYMRISFVIPVYNAEKYIANCLDSICNQNLHQQEYEIVCVNDGSKDCSVERIEKYKVEHPDIQIELITIANSGQSKARNVGVEKAKGKYLFFIDADDYIAHGSIKHLLDLAEKNDLDMLYFDAFGVKNETFIEARYLENSCSEVLDGKNYFTRNVPGNGPWLFLIKRSFVELCNLHFEEGHYCEDGMFAVCATNKARRVAYCRTDVYRYVNRPNSTVTRKDAIHQRKVINDFVYAIRYIQEFIEKESGSDVEGYIQKLIERRDSYSFFLLIRMMRANMNNNERNDVLNSMSQLYLYPNHGLTNDYGRKLVVFSKILQNKFLYFLVCNIYVILDKLHVFH